MTSLRPRFEILVRVSFLKPGGFLVPGGGDLDDRPGSLTTASVGSQKSVRTEFHGSADKRKKLFPIGTSCR